MGLFGWGDNDGREHQLAENAKGDSVTPDQLTTKKKGWLGGRNFLNDKAVIKLISEHEQPHFLLTSDSICGHYIHRESGTNIEPDGKYRTIMLVTNEKIRFLCGNSSGDRSYIVTYEELTKVGYKESEAQSIIGNDSKYGTIKIATDDEVYYFQSSEYYKKDMQNATRYIIEKSDLSEGSVQTDFETPNTTLEDANERVENRLEVAPNTTKNINENKNPEEVINTNKIPTQSISRDYPSDWNSRRKDVYKRDNFTCQNCGSMGGPRGHAELHAHHIVPKSRGGTHNKSNLISLCKECHNTVHSKSKQAPTSHQQPIEKGPEYGEISDAIVIDVATVIDTMLDIINVIESPDVSLHEKANKLEQEAIELRPFVMEIADAIEILDTLPTSNFPSEIITHDKKLMDHSVEVMLLSLDWLETRSNQLREIVEQIYSCPNCEESVNIDEEDFCSSCGAELKLGLCCPSCGKEVFGNNAFCSSCGESLEEFNDKSVIEEKIEDMHDNTEKDFENLSPMVDKLHKLLNEREQLIDNYSQF